MTPDRPSKRADRLPDPTVPPDLYDERYYLTSCAGHPEWVESGGAEVSERYAWYLRLAGLRAGDVLVDIGTGRGELLALAVREGAACALGVEYSRAAVELARRTLASHGAGDRAEVIEADARAIPLDDGIADVVCLLDVVEHLSPDELARSLAEAHRLLRDGGRLLVHTLPNRAIYDVTYRLLRLARADRRRRWPVDPRSEIERTLHVNEQSARSLRRALRAAGFPAATVRPGAGLWAEFVPDEPARGVYRALVTRRLGARVGASDLWGRAVKGSASAPGAPGGPHLPPLPTRVGTGPPFGVYAVAVWRAFAPRLLRRSLVTGKRSGREAGRGALVVHGHSLALGAGASDQERLRFTRQLADRLGLVERNAAAGGAIAHWSSYGDVGDGGYPSVLQGGSGRGALEPRDVGLVLYGANDLAALGDSLRPYAEALRTIVSRLRSARVLEAERAERLQLSPAWELVTGVRDRNSGDGFQVAGSPGARAWLDLGADFAGGAVAVGFVVEPDCSARVEVALSGRVEPAGVPSDAGADPTGAPLASLALDGAAVCSAGRANAIVLRLADLPADARTLELRVTELSSGRAILDYWQIEAEPAPPVLVLTQFPLANYDPYRGWPADPVTDADVTGRLNPATRAVVDEFDSRVLLVECEQAFPGGYTVAWDFYPDDAGHAALAEHVWAQVGARLPELRYG